MDFIWFDEFCALTRDISEVIVECLAAGPMQGHLNLLARALWRPWKWVHPPRCLAGVLGFSETIHLFHYAICTLFLLEEDGWTFSHTIWATCIGTSLLDFCGRAWNFTSRILEAYYASSKSVLVYFSPGFCKCKQLLLACDGVWLWTHFDLNSPVSYEQRHSCKHPMFLGLSWGLSGPGRLLRQNHLKESFNLYNLS